MSQSTADNQKCQLMLKALGYSVGTLDGIIGPNTKNAIRTFQHEYGLTANGIADQDTIDTMYEHFINGTITVHGDVLQLLLFYAGYNPGKIDGVVGKNTANAIYDFQNDNDLETTGKWDNDTIQALKEQLYGAC